MLLLISVDPIANQIIIQAFSMELMEALCQADLLVLLKLIEAEGAISIIVIVQIKSHLLQIYGLFLFIWFIQGRLRILIIRCIWSIITRIYEVGSLRILILDVVLWLCRSSFFWLFLFCLFFFCQFFFCLSFFCLLFLCFLLGCIRSLIFSETI